MPGTEQALNKHYSSNYLSRNIYDSTSLSGKLHGRCSLHRFLAFFGTRYCQGKPSLISPLWFQLPGPQSNWHSQCVPQKGRILKKKVKAAHHHPAAPPGPPRARWLRGSTRTEHGALGAAMPGTMSGARSKFWGAPSGPFREPRHVTVLN